MLTEEERNRFAAYLEQDAASTDGIIEQVKKLGNMEPMVRKLITESAAFKIVAAKLRSTETA